MLSEITPPSTGALPSFIAGNSLDLIGFIAILAVGAEEC
jgi:hypothetical protein